MSYQQNTIKIHDDKITLYRRSDLQSSSWHYRFRFDQKDIRRSAKTANLEEAKGAAVDHFHECRVKLKNSLPIFDHLLKDVVTDFLKSFDHKNITPQKRKHRKAFYKGMLKYWVELYGDRSVNSISQKHITEYLPWRLSYWTAGPGKEKKRPPQAKDNPSDTTLEFEHNALGAVLHFALSKGYVAHHQMPKTKYEGSSGRGTRPAFELREFLRLGRMARNWTYAAKGKPYFWKRWMTWHYVMIMAYTGLRVNEARWLKWKHLEPITDQDGNANYLIHVQETKRQKQGGHRECVPIHHARYWFDRLQKRDWSTGPEDFVFCKKDGSPYRDFSRGFNSLIGFGSGRYSHDRYGRKFTVYSLRHTYFTFQIFHGNNASLIEIAKNGGTSVKMLEDTYIKTDSRKSAHRLGKLDTSSERLAPMEEARKKVQRQPAKVIPYPDGRESA